MLDRLRKIPKRQTIFHLMFSPVYIVCAPLVLGVCFFMMIACCVVTLPEKNYDNPLYPLPSWVAKTIGFSTLIIMLLWFVFVAIINAIMGG